MTIRLTEEIVMNDEESGIVWFYDKRNVIDSMPNLVGFTENKVKLRIKRFLFLEKTLEYKITSTWGGGGKKDIYNTNSKPKTPFSLYL